MAENKKIKLTIELVPSTVWYKNVRSEVSSDRWDRLRKECYRSAEYKCEVCRGTGPKWPVECHEIWHYDDVNKKQILTGLIALCPDCHTVKHPGLAEIKGRFDVVISQLMSVNDMEYWEATEYIEQAFDVWRERSEHQWELDITYLDNDRESKTQNIYN
jgi:hypothetical protein|tara:strand:- start:6291 stop:6767 length:477 start_codon:yes stop_codon:yes gene_type:complete